jgi:hypothetical protein
VADVRISLKQKGGRTHRIELIRQPIRRRFWIRRDGRKSKKMPEATATEIAEAIRKWLVAEHDKPLAAEEKMFDFGKRAER